MDNKSTYSRVHQFETQFDLELAQLKSNPLLAYLGLWVYAEYFGEHPEDADPGRLETIKALLNALKGSAFHNGVHDHEMMYSKESNATQRLPMFSSKAWDFLYKHCDEVVYWTIEDNTITASPAGRARFGLCKDASEVLAFWVVAIKHPKIFPKTDGLDKKMGLDPSVVDFGKMGLASMFNRVCLGALGVAEEVVKRSQHADQLWQALYTSEYNVSGLRQLYLKCVIERLQSSTGLLKALSDLIYMGATAHAHRAFIDLAMVLDVEQLQQIMFEKKVVNTALIVTKLAPDSTLDNEDKHILLKQTGTLLSSEQLGGLANHYASSDWVMLRAIKRKAIQSAAIPAPHQFFDKLEREGDAKHRNTWPVYCGALDRLLTQIELSLKPSESHLYKGLQTVGSYVPPAIQQSRLTTAIVGQFDSITPAMKDLYALHTPEGISLSSESIPSSLSAIFINQFKVSHPTATQINLDDLPTVLQDRLDALRPQLIVAAGVKLDESSTGMLLKEM